MFLVFGTGVCLVLNFVNHYRVVFFCITGEFSKCVETPSLSIGVAWLYGFYDLVCWPVVALMTQVGGALSY